MSIFSFPDSLRAATVALVVRPCSAMDLAGARFDCDWRVVFDPLAALAILDRDQPAVEVLAVASDRTDPAG